MRAKLLALFLSSLSVGNADDRPAVHEASMNFDLRHVRPFLLQLDGSLSLRLDVEKLASFAARTPLERERSLMVKVRFSRHTVPLEFRVFMDDVEAPDLYFFTPSADLSEAIDAELAKFAEQNGL